MAIAPIIFCCLLALSFTYICIGFLLLMVSFAAQTFPQLLYTSWTLSWMGLALRVLLSLFHLTSCFSLNFNFLEHWTLLQQNISCYYFSPQSVHFVFLFAPLVLFHSLQTVETTGKRPQTQSKSLSDFIITASLATALKPNWRYAM